MPSEALTQRGILTMPSASMRPTYIGSPGQLFSVTGVTLRRWKMYSGRMGSAPAGGEMGAGASSPPGASGHGERHHSNPCPNPPASQQELVTSCRRLCTLMASVALVKSLSPEG